MSRSKKLVYLQKPKRIRKSKKDFLRGDLQRVPIKTTMERTTIPLQYIFLFSLFIMKVIGYVSLTFLVSKIHINGNIYNEARVSLPTVPLPNIAVPHLSIPMPHIAIPGVAIFPVVKPVEEIITKALSTIVSYCNPLHYWTNAFDIASQAIQICLMWIAMQTRLLGIQLTKGIQTNGTAILQSIHPLEILHNIVSAISTMAIVLETNIANTGIWIGKAGVDYITLLGNWITTGGNLLLSKAADIGIVLVVAIKISIMVLLELTMKQLAFLVQNSFLVMTMSDTFIENLQSGTNTMLLNITLVILHGVITVILYIVQGIVLFFHGIIFVLESIWSIIVHIAMAIASLCISILTSIKKWLDTTIGGLGAFIHLGDPLYNAIGESISSLFLSMGETISVTSKAVQGGKLQ